jgi:hypothetical protein
MPPITGMLPTSRSEFAVLSIQQSSLTSDGDIFIRANDLLYEFLLANSKGTTLPPVPPSVESPFLANLVRLGFQQDDEESGSDGDGSLTGKVLNLSRADARDRD